MLRDFSRRLHGPDELRVGALLLLPLRHRRLLLEDAEIVDEQLPMQMVDLVQEAAGEQVGGLDRKWLTLAIERPDDNPFGTVDVAEDFGDRQAAFFATRGAVALDNLGV